MRLVSANDHRHERGSAHYAGLAVDLHTSDPAGLAAWFRRIGYRVLWDVPGHYAHVHVETPGSPRTAITAEAQTTNGNGRQER